MTSSVLSGERRWASSRRSGMTVLGKVAVPKPINLPSQRLENHGLDPNVEIVPKGTLSWGSKSSSSSNAWGSSTLSPNTGGGSGSPSHLSALPSSGGSGSRPSTAGGGRAHEAANARGSNSRPSSASGTLASNQTSIASLHPQSAETGPGSSQLSRFCEAVSENSGAWSVVGTAEKLGMTSSKNDGFSFTSGDFPTLGSENDTSVKNERGSQGRPGSSSGVAPMKEMTGTSIVGLKSVNANSWRRDNPPYTEDGVQPSMEKWLADPQGSHPYPNSGIPLQHYDAWCGPPINNHPGGVWYRGPPAGPPYGPPVAPGGFPLEQFPYFRPQIPGSALANPRPGPSPGAGPRGSHPKNGDVYIGPMPDAFVRPGMPIRPAFYPRPVPMAYEGYYGPPMGYCNSNEQDIPFMGMPAGVSAQNWYPVQNAPDPCGFHAPRPTGYGPLGKALAAKHLESGHPHDTRGPCNQHDGWEGKDEEYRSEDNETVSAKKTEQKRTSSWENDCKADQRKVEEVNIGTVVDEASIQVIDYHGNDSILGKVKSSEGMENAEAYGYIAAEKMDHQEVPAAAKNSSLILKIEGLNAKARASDEQCETISFCSKEEQKNKSQVVNAKAKHFANEVATGSRAVFPDGVPASGMIGPTSNEMVVSAGDESLALPDVAGAGANRRSTHSMNIRNDLRGRGSFNSQNADGWRKKPPFTDLPNVKSTMRSENPSDANMQDFMLLEVSETPGSYPQARDKGESMLSVHDPSDRQAQQCVKQQQKEEEQARGKKYKVFAKLEELNRRTKTAEGLTQKLESIPNSTVQHKREEFQTLTEEIIPSSRSEVTSLISNPTVIADAGQSSTGELEKPAILSNQQPLVPKKNFNKATADTHYHSLPLQQQVNNADGALYNYLQASVGSTSKQKHMGYKKKDYNSLDKSSSEKYISARAIELPNIPTDAAVDVALSAGAVINEITSKSKSICEQNVVNEPLMHQKRKNNRSGKNKHKVDEASSMAPLPFGISKETNLTISVDGSKPKSSECESDRSSFQSLTDSKDGNQSSVQDSAFPNEEGRVNNRWKSQHPLRMPRNPQAHRSAVHSGDAVAWAAVQSNNKAEATEGVSHESVVETVVPQANNDASLQNNPRNKRAEMGRYIPKPVAKEMAQQVITQQPVAPSDNQTAADEIMGRADSRSHGVECSQPVGTAMGKVGNTTELTNDGRQSRQGRGHRSWRQQASAEPTLQGLQDGDYSNPSQNAQKSIEQNQHLKPDLCLVKEHPKYDELNTSNGSGIPENPDSTVPQVFPVVRDQGMTGRGKRHAYKEHKGGGNNYNLDPKKFNNCEAGKLNLQSSVTEMVQRDSPAGSKVNLGAGDRSTSHWQPKSAAINRRGSRPDSDQNVGAEIGRTNSKDSVPQGMVSYPSHPDKESGEVMTQPPKDQYNSEKRSAEEAHNVGYLDSKRERNVASLKGRPHSPNQGPGLPVEAPSLYVDSRHEQRSMTGFHKNGNQSNRFGRGHFRGDWGSPGQEMKKHNAPTNHERQRHYEYQPVGPQNNSRTNPDGPKDGSFGSGASFRERSRSHSRHGSVNFHGRQSSSVKE